MNISDFIHKAMIKHNSKYTYENSVYVRSLDKLLITCPIHGDFLQTPSNHLQGRGCKQCQTEDKMYTTEIFKAKATEVHGILYDYSKVNYSTSTTKVTIGCHFHGDFLQSPNKHLFGNGCPVCKASKGELKILKWLQDNGIRYSREKTFKDCINPTSGLMLRYDFYLPDKNFLIEYDGEQHTRPESFGKV